MKKFISIILALVMMFTAISAMKMITFAETEELLENGGFEEGDETGFERSGPACTMEIDGEYAHSGDYGMGLLDRKGQYSVWQQNITDSMIVCGPGKYKASMWCKLMEENSNAQCMLVIRIAGKDGSTSYVTSGYKPITTQWQEYSIDRNIEYDLDNISNVYIYPQCFDKSTNEGVDMCLDDMSLKKTSEVNGREVVKDPVDEMLENLPKVEMKAISANDATRSETTTFGAIRWDAWYGDKNDAGETSVLKQVEKTLTPAKYHFRAPFFAKINDKGKITFPEYTQETFDKEMEYAIEAGVDYFAYCWYSSNMRLSRDLHTTSKYRDQVKMCALLDGNSIGKEYAHKELATLLKESYYMTVLNGRPLMYYFADKNNIDLIGEDIIFYRRLCKQLELPEPYAVIMNTPVSTNVTKYADATSKYGGKALKDGAPYKDFVQNTYQMWEDWRKTGAQIVPALSFGWHVVPRFENPVTWMTASEGDWVDYATPEEITEHIEYAYRYLQQSAVAPFTMANTMIAYAWNEHDEGGWICPTIAVDEEGNQLFNEDGTPKINDERIQAVKKAVQAYKNGELNGTIDLTKIGDPTVIADTGSADKTDKTDKNGGNGWIIPVAIGAAVVVVGGAVVVITVVKKKKKAE